MTDGTSDLAERFAEVTGKDFDDVMERWDGTPHHIAEDLFQVRDIDSRKPTSLTLFPYQRQAMDAYFYGDSSTINVYKGRRIGMSFVFSLCIFIDAIRLPKTFYPIVSVKKTSAENRIDDIYDLAEMCVLDIEFERDNKGIAELWNGSEIEAFSAKVDSDRGDDPAKAVFLDEMAFYEDQDATMRAVRPFISLGENRKIIQVSTPKVDNDTFMQTHKRGTANGTDEDGNNVPISIKQPSFKNPEEIDIYESLHSQDVEPVNRFFNIDVVEEERMQDPEGFAQEYLCEPLSDQYRFFSKDKIEDAQRRGARDNYEFGITANKQYGGRMVMGLDIGVTKDETVVSVFEHTGGARRGQRYLRYWEVIDEDTIKRSGIAEPSRQNPNHVARRVCDIYSSLDVDHVIYDSGGCGQFFLEILRKRIGRGLHPFNFSDTENMAQMCHDLNYGFHNDDVALVPDETMKSQLESIVKEKDEDYKTPRFSGKEYAPEGKDDIAISLILAAYPYHLAEDDNRTLQTADEEFSEPAENEWTTQTRDSRRQLTTPSQQKLNDPHDRNFGSTSGGGRNYMDRTNRRNKFRR